MRKTRQPIAPRMADLAKLHPAGTYANTEDRAAMRLARAIHFAESTCVSVSWNAQTRAQAFYNANGLARTLDESARLEAIAIAD